MRFILLVFNKRNNIIYPNGNKILVPLARIVSITVNGENDYTVLVGNIGVQPNNQIETFECTDLSTNWETVTVADNFIELDVVERKDGEIVPITTIQVPLSSIIYVEPEVAGVYNGLSLVYSNNKVPIPNASYYALLVDSTFTYIEETYGPGNPLGGGGGTQVQSDWAQSDNAEVDFIKNKPTIENIYTADGELEEDRTVGGAGHFLKFEELSSFLAQTQFSKFWMDSEVEPGFFNGFYSTSNFLLEIENASTNSEPAFKWYVKESKGTYPAAQLHFFQHEGPSEAVDLNVYQYNSGISYPRLGGGVKLTSRGDSYGLKLALTTNTNIGNSAVANDLDIEFTTGRAILRNLPTDNTATQVLAKDSNGRLCWRDVSSL